MLQAKEQKEASSEERPREPHMIDQADVLSRLRGMGITDNQDFINEALRALVVDGKICRENYSGPYWVVPNEQQTDSKIPLINQLALIVSQREPRSKVSGFLVEDYRFQVLRNWLAINAQLPSHVIGEYVMPKVLERLLSQSTFIVVEGGFNRTIFVNSDWNR